MTYQEANTILTDYQKWRRGLPPYDGETPDDYLPYDFEHKGALIGEAIDISISLTGYAAAMDHIGSPLPIAHLSKQK